MTKIFICSAYRDDVSLNTEKTKEYCRWAAKEEGVIPIAPHLFFPRFLDENKDSERSLGIDMGIELLKDCSELWYFGDYITEGMAAEISAAHALGICVRYIPAEEIKNIKGDGGFIYA